MTDFSQLRVTIVIPVYGQIHKLALTLESIAAQSHSKLDCILLVKDPSEELSSLISNWSTQINLQTYALHTASLARAYNRGVMLACGHYIQFFEPGDRYLDAHSLSKIVTLAEKSLLPDMVFMGTLRNHESSLSTLWYHSYEIAKLKKAIFPTKLSACLIRRDFLLEEGKFEDYIDEITSFDWFCRMRKRADFQFAFEEYYAIEAPSQNLSTKEQIKVFFQKSQLIYHHFGLRCAILSGLKQKPLKPFLKWIIGFDAAQIRSFLFKSHSNPK